MQSSTNKKLTKKEIGEFQNFIWQFYKQYGRPFAWRNVENSYYILVSEIMLQQTQTYRVEPKFEQFIAAFPDIQTLAQADLRDVLGVWQGLGYNRRGKALWQNAQRVVDEFKGVLPDDPDVLQTFTHIGPNTAASITAFAFNKPVVFIETNIRAVFLHSFFKDQEKIKDAQLMPLIAQTLDVNNAREWYYALMDYGVHLKKSLPNPSRKSAHHAVQSKFQGSDRQIRGKIIKKIVEVQSINKDELIMFLGKESERYERILNALVAEQMVLEKNNQIYIK
ncbi:MAG: A/G-specific adenine glycosylase [Candidatus Dependentiae bacterium]